MRLLRLSLTPFCQGKCGSHEKILTSVAPVRSVCGATSTPGSRRRGHDGPAHVDRQVGGHALEQVALPVAGQCAPCHYRYRDRTAADLAKIKCTSCHHENIHTCFTRHA